jgi:prepilin-type N-terminal cleavage/methylation domain-containing protein
MREKVKYSAASGFSMVELMVVAGIIAILAMVAILSYNPNKTAYRADDTAIQITRFMREATSLASAQRRRMRLEIDKTRRLITLYNEEGSISPGDDVLVRQEIIPGATEVGLTPPSGVALPAAPYNYTAAAYDTTTGVWKGYFQGDGTITDSTNIPLSATFFFTPPGATSTSTSNLQIRAVTVFGPSGAIRLWKYRGSTLQTGVN